MHPLVNIAVKAARKAGKIIVQKSYRVDQLRADRKGARDFVTEVDLLAEQAIVETIHEAYPNHAILTEEQLSSSGRDVEWIIDPLDGTTNYMHGVPQYCVSIAARRKERLEHAIIYDPVHEDLYTANRGEGAQLNNRRIRVSEVRDFDYSLIGTGFPFRETDSSDFWIEVFRDLAHRTSGVRRPGAAALDLAYVACGRYDGFWESGLQPWDMAAGTLLIEEAGGIVTDFSGNPNVLAADQIIAGNACIYEKLFGIISEKYKNFRRDFSSE